MTVTATPATLSSPTHSSMGSSCDQVPEEENTWALLDMQVPLKVDSCSLLVEQLFEDWVMVLGR